MTDTSTFGFPEAASRLGVSLRVLRHAIRAGKVPAPANQAATAKLTSAWFDSVLEAVNASPTALVRTPAYKVAPFARYVGHVGLAEIYQPGARVCAFSRGGRAGLTRLRDRIAERDAGFIVPGAG